MIPSLNGRVSMLDLTAEEFELPGGVEVTVVDLGDGEPPTVQITAPDEPLSVPDLARLADRLDYLVDRLEHGGLRRAVGA